MHVIAFFLPSHASRANETLVLRILVGNVSKILELLTSRTFRFPPSIGMSVSCQPPSTISLGDRVSTSSLLPTSLAFLLRRGPCGFSSLTEIGTCVPLASLFGLQ